MKRRWRKYSKEELEVAVRNSFSWRGVISFLNPENKGYRGSESSIKKKACKMGIDFSHFPGQAWNKGRKYLPKRLAKKKRVFNL